MNTFVGILATIACLLLGYGLLLTLAHKRPERARVLLGTGGAVGAIAFLVRIVS